MDFSLAQIVEMINNFYTAYPYASETAEDFPEVKKLMKCGYVYANEDNNIYLSEKGSSFFQKYIQNFSEQFIDFFKKNAYSCSFRTLVSWAQNAFSVEDDFEIYTFVDYIIQNISNYGYDTKISLSSSGKQIELTKI